MSLKFKFSQLSKSRVTAVLVIDDANDAAYVVDALLSGGINSIEITLRTDAAFAAIDLISKRFSEMITGAGTVLSPDKLERSMQSGASFAVAPGLNPEVVQKAQAINFPFAPGICTPSELEKALGLDCKVVKFFPAEASGGMKYLKSMAAPYTHLGIKYVPLGGIDMISASSYLESDLVLCIGGSWIAKRKIILDRDWKHIEKQAGGVRDLLDKLERDSYEK